MAKLIKADGTETEVKPADGVKFTLEEMQKYVGGCIEIIDLPSGEVLIVNEEGKCVDEPVVNIKATAIWKTEYPISQYPVNNDELVVGDVLLIEDLKEIDGDDKN